MFVPIDCQSEMNPKCEEDGAVNNKEGKDEDPKGARHLTTAVCVIATTVEVAL